MNDIDYLHAAEGRKDRSEAWEQRRQAVAETYDELRKALLAKRVEFPKHSTDFISKCDPNNLIYSINSTLGKYYSQWNPLLDREIKERAKAFVSAVQALLDESRQIVDMRPLGNEQISTATTSPPSHPVEREDDKQLAKQSHEKNESAPALVDGGAGTSSSAPTLQPQPDPPNAPQPYSDASPTRILQPAPPQEMQQILERSAFLEQRMLEIERSLVGAQTELRQIKILASDIAPRHVTRADFDGLLYQYNTVNEAYLTYRRSIAEQIIQTMTTLSNQLGVDLSSDKVEASGLISREVIDSAMKTMSIRLESILRNASGLVPIPIVIGMPFDGNTMEEVEPKEPTGDPNLAHCVARIVERGYWLPSGQHRIDRPAKVILYVLKKGR